MSTVEGRNQKHPTPTLEPMTLTTSHSHVVMSYGTSGPKTEKLSQRPWSRHTSSFKQNFSSQRQRTGILKYEKELTLPLLIWRWSGLSNTEWPQLTTSREAETSVLQPQWTWSGLPPRICRYLTTYPNTGQWVTMYHAFQFFTASSANSGSTGKNGDRKRNHSMHSFIQTGTGFRLCISHCARCTECNNE